MNKSPNYASWILQAIIAAILIPAVYAKLSAQPDSVAAFSQLDMEPGGRYLIAILEAITILLLLIPGSVAWGAILGWGVMTGAIIAHITKLGFAEAMMHMTFAAATVWLACSAILVLRRNEIEFVKSMFSREETSEPPRD